MKTCLNCSEGFIPCKNSLGLYCSTQCSSDHRYKRYVKSWLAGNEKGWSGRTRALSKHVRRWVRETRGFACEECGWDKTHPVDGWPLTEIDHIDGDAENVKPENLRVLCPNCHSMTSTFRARNKNSKRNRVPENLVRL